MARNDVGGTGVVNLLHYLQLVFSGKFQTPARDNLPAPEDYDTSKLRENLNDT